VKSVWQPFVLVLVSLAGCGGGDNQPLAQPDAATMAKSRSQAAAPSGSVKEIGERVFGEALKDVSEKKGVASYTFAAKQDSPTPEQNFRRFLLVGAIPIPATFASQKQIETVRITAADEAKPGRRLLVFSMLRSASEKVDWEHSLSADILMARSKIEYVDPEYREFAPTTRK
jgi:hypothetical protein